MQAEFTHQIETEHGTIEFLDIGSGTPVLYFHGTGAGNDAAILLERRLIESGCRLIIPNRPGYGGTTLRQPGSSAYAAVLAAELLKHLSVERVVVMGTSGGGMPAAAFARKFPEQTAGLVLQCAQSHSWTSGEWLPVGLGPFLFLFRWVVFRPFLRWQNLRSARLGFRNHLACLRNMSGRRCPEIASDHLAVDQIRRLTEMSLQCAHAPAGIQNDWMMLIGDNGVSAGIECPTLVIHDRTDPLVPFCHAEWSCQRIPHAELLEVQAGGHLIWFGKDAERLHLRRMEFIGQVF